MAKKLYLLRNVPDDEADEMRALLREHQIDYHETSAGFFGFGTAAIWVNDPARFDEAKQLIAQYQQQRYETAREQWLMLKAEGRQKRFIDVIRQNPVKVVIYFLIALAFLSLVTLPYFL